MKSSEYFVSKSRIKGDELDYDIPPEEEKKPDQDENAEDRFAQVNANGEGKFFES